ncbi:MAG: B12-binding domain-containing radical SAM protein [Planctomycetota bacterium]|nr:B12-binding domain-containing radical SAM protein [Planctomycetota bacterium]
MGPSVKLPGVPDIVLTTLNARYAHAAFGLRYLMANLGPLQPRARLLEFDINQRPLDIIESILAENPRIVGIGIYIWNVAPATQLVAELKRIRPDIIIILGGPEVSHETAEQEICRLADYVITGEADLVLQDLCGKLLAGQRPLMRTIAATLPEFSQLSLPYDFYDDVDLAQRVIYVEASRGCPFKCEFCLSSLDVPVRNAPLEDFLAAMAKLMDRGARQLKFVDRTFNLNLNLSRAILEFFLERYSPGLFLHFEMIPDRLPQPLRELIRRFPPGALQFEVGIQTFNPEVAARISRRQDVARLSENLRFLRRETGVHVHADLIAGLPGEDLASFGAGFDQLVALDPQEIQVGILKRLRGTPIVRHDAEWGMVYSPYPPYEILQTKTIDFATMHRLRRFARYWDLVANSGNFIQTAPLLWRQGSPFKSFMQFSDWLFIQIGKNHGIALARLAELLLQYLVEECNQPGPEVAQKLWEDYHRAGRSDRPVFLRKYLSEEQMPMPRRSQVKGPATRQLRRLV